MVVVLRHRLRILSSARCDRMAQVSIWFLVINFGRLNEAVDHRARSCSCLTGGEQPVKTKASLRSLLHSCP